MVPIYPSHVSWHLDLQHHQSPDTIFSSSTGKKIRRGLQLIQNSSYKLVIEPVTKDYMSVFTPLYIANILEKDSPQVMDTTKAITEKLSEGEHIFAVSLYDEALYLGGMIFRMSQKSPLCSVIYKVFPKELSIALPISVSFLAEYKLYAYAIEQGATSLVHGRDRNVYGQHLSLGLAAYKCTVGCAPHVSKTDSTTFTSSIESPKHVDTLIFLGSEKGAPVTHAILFSESREESYLQRFGAFLNNKYFECEIRDLSELR